jgi:hypothetical protein
LEKLYSLACNCGRTHQVSGTDAGCDIHCDCGQTISVPSLQQLRISAGESPLSAEMTIEALLLKGQLPEETHCLGCGATTTETAYVTVSRERPEVQARGWTLNFFALLFGWISMSWSAGHEQGRDVSFCLPLRICRECGQTPSESKVRDFLRQVPLYRQLLDKYTAATWSALRF